MKRARRTELGRIRKVLVAEYHKLSAVLCDDWPEKRIIQDAPDRTEVGQAFDKVSDAINCLNRELGRPENS